MSSIVTVAGLDEDALIARIRERVPVTHDDLLIGIGDDGAMARGPRNRALVITTDMVVEDIHFRRHWSTASDIGAKAVLVNVSDLGAMGAEPRLATLSLALPADFPLRDFDALAEGAGAAARKAGMAVAGGNLTRSPGPLVIDVTAIGAVHPRKVLRRDAANPEEPIYLTGTIGLGAAGLAWLERRGPNPADDSAARAVRQTCRPSPSARAGLVLSRAGASRAAIDLSDGLADGLRRLTRASGCGATIDATALPVDPAAAYVFDALGLPTLASALAGGDDYGLLFTVPTRRRGAFRAARRHLGVEVTEIGVMTREPGLRVVGADRALDLASMGFDHFRPSR